jgi:hypothetical protein
LRDVTRALRTRPVAVFFARRFVDLRRALAGEEWSGFWGRTSSILPQ